MKKLICLVLVVMMVLAMVPVFASEYSTDDYSWLDDMTIKQLKDLDVEIHKRISYEGFDLSDDSIDKEIDTPTNNEMSDTTEEELPVVGKWIIGDAYGQSYILLNPDYTGESGGTSNTNAIIETIAFNWEMQDNLINITRPDGVSYSLTLTDDNTLALTNNPSRVFVKAEEIEEKYVGTYVEVLADDTATLVIRSDGSATIRVAQTEYSCTCTQEGDILTFKQGNSTIIGVWENNTISMTFAGINLVFSR